MHSNETVKYLRGKSLDFFSRGIKPGKICAYHWNTTTAYHDIVPTYARNRFLGTFTAVKS